MLEQGLVQFVNANSAVTAICPSGGFLGTIPKDHPMPSWAFLLYGLRAPDGLIAVNGGGARVNCQIDVFGSARADVVNLTQAIKAVLHGFRGTFPDPDSTYIDSCLLIDLRDLEEDPDSRVFRRMSEYEIRFHLK